MSPREQISFDEDGTLITINECILPGLLVLVNRRTQEIRRCGEVESSPDQLIAYSEDREEPP